MLTLPIPEGFGLVSGQVLRFTWATNASRLPTRRSLPRRGEQVEQLGRRVLYVHTTTADAVGVRARFGVRTTRKVELERSSGVGRGIATYTIPIEGRDEWLVLEWRRDPRGLRGQTHC